MSSARGVQPQQRDRAGERAIRPVPVAPGIAASSSSSTAGPAACKRISGVSVGADSSGGRDDGF